MDEFLTNLRNNHADFHNGSLVDQLKGTDPITLFKQWLEEAYDKNCPEPNAMVVSTVDENKIPSSRVVYFKELKENALVFYTNYESKKGKDISKNPIISVLFFWEKLTRQVRIVGEVEKTPRKLSEDYFSSRPRKSQLGAWTSRQSERIEDREALEKALEETTQRFAGKEVPCPPFWGGYLIRPLTIEFWQGRPSRLHDRIVFERKDTKVEEWEVSRRNP